MIDCGDRGKFWVEVALGYLPEEVLNQNKENIVFVDMSNKDGCRLTKKFCEEKDIIILSEHILPKHGAHEGEPSVRYYIYVVLHEFAHAIKNHKSPRYDPLTKEDIASQETEANEMALKWFNDYVSSQGNPYMKLLSKEEIKIAMDKNIKLMEQM
jgi:hypothetical protein